MPSPKRPARPPRQRGFVLLYVLWIMAAVALTLAAFSLKTSGGASVTEQELAHSLETRQMVTVLDYVLRHSAEFDPRLDPRLEAFDQVMAQQSAQAAAVDDRLAVLREILAAMKFNLEAADPRKKPGEKAGDKKGGASAAGGGPAAPARATTVKYRPGSAVHSLRIDDAEFSVSMEAGNARPNLNLLEPEPFERYLAHLGVPAENAKALAAAIRDWTDEDDFTRDGGAESSYYRGLPLPYSPRNGRFGSTSELGYVKGMTPEVLRLLRENFSLHGADPGVIPGVLSDAAFGALAELPPERAKLGLQLATGAIAARPETPMLLQEETAKLARVLSLREDARLVRVRVQGKHSRVTAWYDTEARRILDWWFD